MSDWACTYSAENAANNGLDLEMESNRCFNRTVLHALIDAGKVSEETINEKVRRIYRTCMEIGFFDNKQDTRKYNIYNNEANKMAYKAASEGIILLKNNGILPIKKDVKSIAVIGPNANPVFISDRIFNNMSIVYGGGGSSKVNS